MILKIGNTDLNVRSAFAFRYPNGKLVLKIEVMQDEIEHDDLKALIKDNTSDIVLTTDDGKQETFSGYGYTLTILDKDDVYYVEVECVAEIERKVGEMETVIAEQNATINEQSEVINELNDTLLEFILG